MIGSFIDELLLSPRRVEDLFLKHARVLKSSRSTHSVLAQPEVCAPPLSLGARPEAGVVFAKKYLLKNLPHSLKPLFLRHRSRIVWELSWYLLGCGVSVPEPLGYLVKRVGPFCVAGYFFSEAISDCVSLLDLARHAEKQRFGTESVAAIELVVEHVARMHDWGVTHGDLKWSNILLDGELKSLWLVDLDSARYRGRRLDPHQVARDLARFVLNGMETGAEDVSEYFLQEYARSRNMERQHLEAPMSRVLKKLAGRHRHRDLRRAR